MWSHDVYERQCWRISGGTHWSLRMFLPLHNEALHGNYDTFVIGSRSALWTFVTENAVCVPGFTGSTCRYTAILSIPNWQRIVARDSQHASDQQQNSLGDAASVSEPTAS